MNEQQLADLFSEQLDQLLLGREPVVPAEASNLHSLLNLGQQFSQVDFQAGPAGQMAFQNQLSTWFGPTHPPASTFLGLSKPWIMGLILAAVLVGSGIIAVLLSMPGLNDAGVKPAKEAPEVVIPEEAPATSPDPQPVDIPKITNPVEQTVPAEKPAETTSSQGDVMPAVTSSQGDVLLMPTPDEKDALPLPTFSLKDSLSLPAEESDSLTPSGEITGSNDTPSADTATEASGDGESAGSGAGDTAKGDDHDRGHGNDASGFDPDNPGNSIGVGGGSSGFDLEKLGRGDSGGGKGGGSDGGGNKGNSGDKGGGNGKGKGKNK